MTGKVKQIFIILSTLAVIFIAAPAFPAELALDVDGNGVFDPLTDGIIIMRYGFGLTGNDLIRNAIGANAKRTSAADIATYLSNLGVCGSTTPANKSIDFLTVKASDLRCAVVFFCGTYCPYCVTVAPEFKIKIQDKFADKIGVFTQVIDGDIGRKFDVDGLNQGYNVELNLILSNMSCGYIPSWVLFDSSGIQVAKSCGNEKTIDDLAAEIERLISNSTCP